MLAFLFSRIQDPRKGQGLRYALVPLMHRMVLATLAGADGIRSMARWCETHHDDLNHLLGTRWHKAPDFSTWRIFIKALSGVDFEPALGTLGGSGDLLHIDGKALRGSIKKDRPWRL